jgi:hypothetical protein
MVNYSSFNNIFNLDANYVYVTRSSTVGGNTVNYIGKWDGSADTIAPLANGVNNISVATIIPETGKVYVCGEFTQAGGSVDVNRIAYYNGTSWDALGGASLFTNTVTEMAYDSTNNLLYAGSHGTTTSSNRIAVWNGTIWTGISDTITVNSYPHMTVDTNTGDLYVGYGSTLAIRSYQNSTWSSLSVGGTIYDICFNSTSNAVFIGLTLSTFAIKYYDIALSSLVSLPSVASVNMVRCYSITFDTNNNLIVSGEVTSGYINSIMQYTATNPTDTDGIWTGIYNYQDTFGVLTVRIGENGNIFAYGNVQGLIIGTPPYTNGNWQQFTETTSIDYGGVVVIGNEEEGEEEILETELFLLYTPLNKLNYSNLINIGDTILYKNIQNNTLYNNIATYLKNKQIRKINIKSLSDTQKQFIIDSKKK